MTTFARAEREALCDLALDLDEDADTLCEGWNAKDLIVHLLVRERSITGAPGILVSKLSWRTDQVSERWARADFALLVDQLRRPRATPSAISRIDSLMNSVEFFVHHEDLRRAQPGWAPRVLPQNLMWRFATRGGRMLTRKLGVPVTLERTDTGERAVMQPAKDAEKPVTIRALPAELVLWLFGRDELHELTIDGPTDALAALQQAHHGV